MMYIYKYAKKNDLVIRSFDTGKVVIMALFNNDKFDRLFAAIGRKSFLVEYPKVFGIGRGGAFCVASPEDVELILKACMAEKDRLKGIEVILEEKL